jgi:capsular polysaccharide biosynthesis protein
MEYDLRDYFKIIRKRMWMILAVVIISCMTTGVISYFFIQPTYEASTKLIVNKSDTRPGNETVDINSVNLNLRLIDTYKEVIKTPRIMGKVEKQYPEFGLTSDQLIQKVKVSSVNNTQVMTLIVQDRSYVTAARIVNAVSKVFEKEIPLIMKVDNVSLLNEANEADKPLPVKPNPKLNIAISFVVALMISFGIAFLLEYLDDTIKSEADVQNYLNLPTLTMVTKMRTEDFVHQNSPKTELRGSEAPHVTINQ